MCPVCAELASFSCPNSVSTSAVVAVVVEEVGKVSGVVTGNQATDSFTYYFEDRTTGTVRETVAGSNVIVARAGDPVTVRMNPWSRLAAAGNRILVDRWVVGQDGVDASATPLPTLTFTVPPQISVGTFPIGYSANGGASFDGGAAVSLVVMGPPTITALSPSSGSYLSAVTVTIYGNSFHTGIWCQAGAVQAGIAAVPVGTLYDTLTCSLPAPASASPVNVAVEVSLPGGTTSWTDFGKVYSFTVPHVVSSVAPAMGTLAGGEPVTLTGTGFKNSAAARCRFNFIATSEPPHDVPLFSYISATTVVCLAPNVDAVFPLAPPSGIMTTVDYASSGLDFTNNVNSVQYTMVRPPRITLVTPANAPNTGGVTVTVVGSNLTPFPGANLRCAFGGVPSPLNAISVSDTQFLCAVPSVPGVSQSVAIEVAVNSVDFSQIGYQVYLHSPVANLAVTPEIGPFGQPYLISITGTNFFDPAPRHTIKVELGLGNTVTGSLAAGGTAITFSAATVAAASQVSIRITFNDGAAFSTSKLLFTFVLPATATSVSPRVAVFGGAAGAVPSAPPPVQAASGIFFPAASPITITGTNFINTRWLSCRWTSTVNPGVVVATKPAFFYSANLIKCPVLDAPSSPDAPVGGVLELSVSLNGVYYIAPSPNTVLYYQPPAVLAMAPRAGPAGGGTLITLTSAAAFPTVALPLGIAWDPQCVFTTTRVTTTTPATIVSASQATCSTPAWVLDALTVAPYTPSDTSATVHFSLSGRSNPQEFPNNSFLYRRFWSVTNMVALTGGAIPTPTTVQVNRVDFSPGADLTGPALITIMGAAETFMDLGIGLSMTVTASSPGTPANLPACTVTLSRVTDTSATFPSNALNACIMASNPKTATYDLSVSYNSGANVITPCLTLRAAPAPSVSVLTPPRGVAGTLVTVTGTGFYQDPNLACQFNTYRTAAIFHTTSAIVCQAPPLTCASAGCTATLAVLTYASGPGFTVPGTFTYISTSAAPACAAATVTPSSGPASGGTSVTVSTTNWPVCGSTCQRVALAPGGLAGSNPSIVLSASEGTNTLTFVSPLFSTISSDLTSTVKILASYNQGTGWTLCGATYTYYPDPSVTAITPSYTFLDAGAGPTAVVVTLSGANFAGAGGTRTCRFRSSDPAGSYTYSSSSAVPQAGNSQLVCTLSAAASAYIGLYHIDVTLNGGASWSPAGNWLHELLKPKSLSTVLYPRWAFTGNAAATVVNVRLGESATEFGASTLEASDVKCAVSVPPAAVAFSAPTQLPSPTRAICSLPAVPEGSAVAATVALSLVGTTVPPGPAATFNYFGSAAPTFTLLTPSGSVRGGSTVLIKLPGMTGLQALATNPVVMFDGVRGSAAAVTDFGGDAYLTCVSPNMAKSRAVDFSTAAAIVVAVTVSLNAYVLPGGSASFPSLGEVYPVGPFTCTKPVTLTAVSPTVVYSATDTVVTVTGTNLPADAATYATALADPSGTTITCKFTSFPPGTTLYSTASSTFVSATQVGCPLPSGGFAASTKWRVDISLADVVSPVSGVSVGTFTANGVFLDAISKPTVSGVFPLLGKAAGGTFLAISGANFPKSARLLCLFTPGIGDPQATPAPVVATWASANSINCYSPAMTASGVPTLLSVSANDGAQYTNAVNFKYISDPTITLISPASVAVVGSQVITLSGTGFVPGGTLQCRFGNGGGITAASQVGGSSTRITCLTPVFVLSNPAVTVEVGVNTVEFFGIGGPTLAVALAPTMFTVVPRANLDYTGTYSGCVVIGQCLVTITGVSFQPASTWVRIGKATEAPVVLPAAASVGAGVASSTAAQVLFWLPAYSAGNHPIDVSVNGGLDYTSSGLTLIYTGSPIVSTVSPGWTAQGLSGTAVTITGVNFVDRPGLSCAFGPDGSAVFAQARVVNPFTISCKLPAGGSSVSARVATVGSGVLTPGANVFGSVANVIARVSVPAFTDVTPDAVSYRGSTLPLTITASSGLMPGAASASDMRCRIGLTTILPALTSPAPPTDTKLTCSIPAYTGTLPAMLRIYVSFNKGALFLDTGATFGDLVYQVNPVVASLLPKAGGAGTKITITGTDLVQGGGQAAVRCYFTSVSDVNNAGRVTVVPDAPGSTTAQICTAPAGGAGEYFVEVSTNLGSDVTADGAIFSYVAPMVVASIGTPPVATVSADAAVTVTGTGFASLDSLVCGFNSASNSVTQFNAARVLYVSPTTVVCYIDAGTLAAGTYIVGISPNDGATWSAGFTPYSALSPLMLTVYVLPTVSTVNPPAIPIQLAPDSTLTITGAGFTAYPSATQLCLFNGGFLTTASISSSSTVVCPTPASLMASLAGATGATAVATVTVAVSIDSGMSFSSTTASFAAYPPPVVTSLTPSIIVPNSAAGSPSFPAGRTSITLTGSNFWRLAWGGFTLRCAFHFSGGDVLVPADPGGVSTVVCPSALKNIAGAVQEDVRITLVFGQTLSSFYHRRTGFVVTYAPHPAFGAPVPNSGPTVGGTTVVLSGTSLAISHSGAMCRFGATLTVPARVYEDGLGAECVAPPLGSGSEFLYFSYNGDTWANLGQSFVYFVQPSITAIVPSRGLVTGGTPFTLQGSNFPLSGYTIRFGFGAGSLDVQSTSCTSATGTSIICSSSGTPLAPFGAAGAVSVSFTRNGGADWATNPAVSFLYLDPVLAATVTPVRAQSTFTGQIFTISAPSFGIPTLSPFTGGVLAELACRFETAASSFVSGTVLTGSTDTSLLCQAGTASTVLSTVNVYFSVNGGAEWTRVLAAISISPNPTFTGPLDPPLLVINNPANVVVTGTGFVGADPSSTFKCKLSPPSSAPMVDAIVLVAGSKISCVGIMVTDTDPTGPPALNLMVSFDSGATFIDTGLFFSGAETFEFDRTGTFVRHVSCSSPRSYVCDNEDKIYSNNAPRNIILYGTYDAGLTFECEFSDSVTGVVVAVNEATMSTPSGCTAKQCMSCTSPQVPVGLYNIRINADGGKFRTPVPHPFEIAACPAGRYCPLNLNTNTNVAPVPCPAGHFCPGTDNRFPIPCPAGTWTGTTLQEVCSPCPAGQYCAGPIATTADFAFTGLDAAVPGVGTDYPKLCPTGFVCLASTAVPSLLCPAGYYCPLGTSTVDPAAGAAAAFSYQAPGQATPTAYAGLPLKCGSTLVSNYCPGNLEFTSLAATPRPRGQTVALFDATEPTSARSCFPRFLCQTGETTPQGSGACKIGYYCPANAAAAPCQPGTFAASTGQLTCDKCPAGTYQPNTGSSSCLKCPLGAQCPDDGMSSTQPCPRGLTCPIEGTISASTPCPPGFICLGGTGAIDRKLQGTLPESLLPLLCPAGYYCLAGVAYLEPWTLAALANATAGLTVAAAAALANTRPQPCYEGTYCNAGASTQLGTGLCPAGSYCPARAVNFIKSPVGYYVGNPGQSAPSLCPQGTFSDVEGLTECLPCPPGYYCPLSTLGPSSPVMCGGGTYRGFNQNGGQYCSSCPISTIDLRSGNLPPRPQVYALAEDSTKIPAAYDLANFKPIDRSIATPGTYDFGIGIRPLSRPMLGREVYWKDLVSGALFPKLKVDAAPLPLGSAASLGTVDPGYAVYGATREAGDGLEAVRVAVLAWRGALSGAPAPFWWSPMTLGSSDMCSPCPSGFMCDAAALDTPTAAMLCPEGQVCDKGASQPCPESFYCLAGSDPATAKKFLCPAGMFCPLGTTPKQARSELYCRSGYYCPAGTSQADSPLLQCPATTRSQAGASSIWQCQTTNDAERRALSEAVPKPKLAATATAADSTKAPDVDENGRVQCSPLQTCTFTIDSAQLQKAGMAYGSAYRPAFYHVTTAEGTTAGKLLESVVAKAPEGLQSVDAHAELARAGLVRMGPVRVATRRQLAASQLGNGTTASTPTVTVLQQDTFYRLPPPNSLFSRQYDNTSVPATFSVQPSRESLRVQIVIEIVNALFIQNASSITRDAVSFTATQASRGGPQPFTFMTVLENLPSVELPLNLVKPATIGDVAAAGTTNRSLSATANPKDVASGLANLASGFESAGQLFADTYESVVADRTVVFKGALTAIALPYLPFFSACAGYDSYVTLYRLLESEQCRLANRDATVWAVPWSPTTRPEGDVCDYRIQCMYEERLGRREFTTRWFELSDKDTIFHITSEPVDTAKYVKDGGASIVARLGKKTLVPVIVKRTNVAAGQVPGRVTLRLQYQQVTEASKRILVGTLTLEDLKWPCTATKAPCVNDCTACRDPATNLISETEKPDRSYSLQLRYEPLAYVDLLVLFAFDVSIYVTIYLCVALFTLLTIIVFWLAHKVWFRRRFAGKLHFRSYFHRNVIPHYSAVIANGVPIGGGLVLIWWAFGVLINRIIGSSLPGDYTLFDGAFRIAVSLSPIDYQGFATGRYALALLVFSMIVLGAASTVFVPERTPTLEEVTSTVDYRWARAEFLVSAVAMMVVQIVMVEFSYSTFFSQWSMPCIIFISLGKVILSTILLGVLKDRLLVDALVLAFTMCQYIITLGASNYFTFLGSFVLTMWLDVIAVVFVNRLARRLLPKLLALVRGRGGRRRAVPSAAAADKSSAAAGETAAAGGLGKKVIKASASALNEARVRAVEEEEEEIDTATYDMLTYLSEATVMELSLLCSSIVFYYLMLFAPELKLYQLYPIPNGSMVLYLIGISIVVVTLGIGSVFLHHTQELRNGWRIFQYLDFTHQRSLAKGSFWHRFHHLDVDRSIHPYLRSVDAMCLSVQYSMILVFFAAGSVVGVMAVEMSLRSTYTVGNAVKLYNAWADPLAPLICVLVAVACVIVQAVFLWGARAWNKRFEAKVGLEKSQRRDLQARKREAAAAAAARKDGKKEAAGASARSDDVQDAPDAAEAEDDYDDESSARVETLPAATQTTAQELLHAQGLETETFVAPASALGEGEQFRAGHQQVLGERPYSAAGSSVAFDDQDLDADAILADIHADIEPPVVAGGQAGGSRLPPNFTLASKVKAGPGGGLQPKTPERGLVRMAQADGAWGGPGAAPSSRGSEVMAPGEIDDLLDDLDGLQDTKGSSVISGRGQARSTQSDAGAKPQMQQEQSFITSAVSQDHQPLDQDALADVLDEIMGGFDDLPAVAASSSGSLRDHAPGVGVGGGGGSTLPALPSASGLVASKKRSLA